MSELEFKKAVRSPHLLAYPQVYVVRNGPPQTDLSNETRLSYYKFFKQATAGNNYVMKFLMVR